jgi:hypothetical protein
MVRFYGTPEQVAKSEEKQVPRLGPASASSQNQLDAFWGWPSLGMTRIKGITETAGLRRS